jgi:uncharacterized circularly permuted ATP-grasp superfamily protein
MDLDDSRRGGRARASLIVNSSRGGGVKDTWLVAE